MPVGLTDIIMYTGLGIEEIEQLESRESESMQG